jgi:hypothetical protein
MLYSLKDSAVWRQLVSWLCRVYINNTMDVPIFSVAPSFMVISDNMALRQVTNISAKHTEYNFQVNSYI